MLLLYAQPLTRIARLRTGDIQLRADGQILISLVRGYVLPPEPLASLALALRYECVTTRGGEGWLLPGRLPGTHASAEQLGERLKRHGIRRSRPGKQAALLALAARLPAPILAERIGIHQAPRRPVGARRRRDLRRLRRPP
jgi:hypothetical protein